MHSYFEIKICETHFKEKLYFCAMNRVRKLLLPFSLVYGSILALRNLFYDKGWFKSKSYATPIICIGNLSIGGTGKSPMIEYLISFLKKDYKVFAYTVNNLNPIERIKSYGVDGMISDFPDRL